MDNPPEVQDDYLVQAVRRMARSAAMDGVSSTGEVMVIEGNRMIISVEKSLVR